MRVTASSVIYSVSVLSLQLYMGVLSLMSSTVCVLPLSVTCRVKCVITSTVYGCVITYELNCLRVTASSVSMLSLQLYVGVLSLISSTVCVLPLPVLYTV